MFQNEIGVDSEKKHLHMVIQNFYDYLIFFLTFKNQYNDLQGP